MYMDLTREGADLYKEFNMNWEDIKTRSLTDDDMYRIYKARVETIIARMEKDLDIMESKGRINQYADEMKIISVLLDRLNYAYTQLNTKEKRDRYYDKMLDYKAYQARLERKKKEEELAKQLAEQQARAREEAYANVDFSSYERFVATLPEEEKEKFRRDSERLKEFVDRESDRILNEIYEKIDHMMDEAKIKRKKDEKIR